jgi:hypothetical protein
MRLLIILWAIVTLLMLSFEGVAGALFVGGLTFPIALMCGRWQNKRKAAAPAGRVARFVDEHDRVDLTAEEYQELSSELADHIEEGFALIERFRAAASLEEVASLLGEAESIAEDIAMCRDQMRDGMIVFDKAADLEEYRQAIADGLDLAMRLRAAVELRVSPAELMHRRDVLSGHYRIRYVREDGKLSIRNVQPVGHSVIGDRAYLWAYCERSEKILTFRTDRIKALTDGETGKVDPADIAGWLATRAGIR